MRPVCRTSLSRWRKRAKRRACGLPTSTRATIAVSFCTLSRTTTCTKRPPCTKCCWPGGSLAPTSAGATSSSRRATQRGLPRPGSADPRGAGHAPALAACRGHYLDLPYFKKDTQAVLAHVCAPRELRPGGGRQRHLRGQHHQFNLPAGVLLFPPAVADRACLAYRPPAAVCAVGTMVEAV